ncbi:hypothetical protein [Streptomyces xantholiticus]|uniref:hypothetical protein n=1 Tax=Streptomyces xantholiticus TaxID=68285 RepID=UPI001673B512|nr:hypothetical protein [Streptomyces xantholiticus]GGW65649.1 hypothetical protein GCM10010381_58450 [Streptomyces xantholiticus]
MDPVTLAAAAGSALVAAMATDTWTQARAAMVTMWRRARPDRAAVVEEDLDELHREALGASQRGDGPTQDALAADWQQQLARLLRQNPELAGELERVLNDVLAPSLGREEREHIYQQTNVAGGNGRVFGVQSGNLIYHEGRPSRETRPPSTG